jgi:uncharacterized protein YjbI with pentapeptide repeats
MPFLLLDWVTDWAAYGLSRTSLLEFLEYCGSFSILIVVIFYFHDGPERTKLKHYQAWQVINTAQGKGGSGGRSEALHELNEDHVPLVGVDLSDAFLQAMDLQQADLRRSLFRAADLKDANLSGSNLEQAQLENANLRNDNLRGVNFTDAALSDCDLNGASMAGCNLHGARFDRADLRGVDLAGAVDWKSIAGIGLANIHGIKNPPEGFVAWALGNGAVDFDSDTQWTAAIRAADSGKPR